MLGGSLAPDDAPPGYVEVATLLQAARSWRPEPVQMDAAFPDRLVETVLSARRDGKRSSSWWSPSRRRAAISALVVAAATSSLATADPIPSAPFGRAIDAPGLGDGRPASGRPLPGGTRTVEARDSRAEAFGLLDESLVTPAMPAAAAGASAPWAPSGPVAGAPAPPPPQPGPATPSGRAPPGQARRSLDALPGQGRPPAHAGNNGNSSNGEGPANPQARPPASAGETPGQGNAYGRDGEPGPPAARTPRGRGNR